MVLNQLAGFMQWYLLFIRLRMHSKLLKIIRLAGKEHWA
jgi:hypothetical protein